MSKRYTAALIAGDGIGPEVTQAAVDVLTAAGVRIDWERALAGTVALKEAGALLPETTLDAVKRHRVALKGPITTPIGEGYPSINVQIRKRLDLYACLRPVKSLPGVKALFDNVDLAVVRENTEDLYAGIEHEIIPGVVETLKIITRTASLRIAQFAFDYAAKEGRKKVTAVHKANIMKLSDGLFLQCCREVAARHPSIAYEELIVDNTCLQLLLNPTAFDVLLMENLYGDVISDLAAGLVGGIGLVAGANIGEHYAVFEPVHGSWPSAAGKGLANPTAAILCGAMLLEHIGEAQAARRVQDAVTRVLHDAAVRTSDLGGAASTRQFTEAVIRALG